MITQEQIDNYIERVPPAPKVLKETLELLSEDELARAANKAKEDIAFNTYLKSLLNKPSYGLKKSVSDTPQMFSLLGISGSKQAVFNYMMSLLSPKEWQLFKLKSSSFNDLQACLSGKWNLILKHLNVVDKNLQSSISLLPASIIVTEALFKERIEEVKLLKETKDIDYNTILKRVAKIDIFDLCEQIAKKWEMHPDISAIVQSASGLKPSENENINKLGKWMHLLLFYIFSKPTYIEAGLNDFIDFNVEYVSDIYEEFLKVVKEGE